MNKYEMIHETQLRDIVNLITGTKEVIDNHFRKNGKNMPIGSIAKQASGLTLVFPVIISDTLNINTAMIISKAIERKCVSLLQMLFASIQISDAKTVQDFVGKFHHNIDTRMVSFDDFLDAVTYEHNSGNLIVNDKDTYDMVMEDMKNINHVLSTEFNKTSINDYMVVNSFGEQMVYCESKDNQYSKYRIDTDHFDVNVKVNQPSSGNNRNNTKDKTDYFTKQLLPNEVKKANELLPTLMYVNFTHSEEGKESIETTGVIGVKAKMYPVSSADIIDRVISKNKNSGLFGLIRASTREISFFKDFLFAIDKAKLDAKYASKDSNNASMFKVLERRAAAKMVNSKLLKNNDASPITSLVISQAEVDQIKQSNFDLEKSANARTILNAYNLMDIVVVDETLEIAKFMFDDDNGVYEALTFDALEKQNADNSTKKIVNLLSKANR